MVHATNDPDVCVACGTEERCSSCSRCLECEAAAYKARFPDGVEEIVGHGRDGSAVVEVVSYDPAVSLDECCPECRALPRPADEIGRVRRVVQSFVRHVIHPERAPAIDAVVPF